MIEEPEPEPPADPVMLRAIAEYDAITKEQWQKINREYLRFSRNFHEEQEAEYGEEAFPLAAFPEAVRMDYSLLSYLDHPGLSCLGFKRYYKTNRLRELFDAIPGSMPHL